MAKIPFPSLMSPLVGPLGQIIPPWNNYFQQFSLPPAKIQNIALGASPYSYTASSDGNLVISGGTVSNVNLTRGGLTINLPTSGIMPMTQGDVIQITYSVLPTVNFIPA